MNSKTLLSLAVSTLFTSRRIKNSGYIISTKDFAILFRLLKKGAMLQIEVTSLLMRDKKAFSHCMNTLVKKDYVQRTFSSDDRHYFFIDLSQPGHEILKRLSPLITEFQQNVLNPIFKKNEAMTIKAL